MNGDGASLFVNKIRLFPFHRVHQFHKKRILKHMTDQENVLGFQHLLIHFVFRDKRQIRVHVFLIITLNGMYHVLVISTVIVAIIDIYKRLRVQVCHHKIGVRQYRRCLYTTLHLPVKKVEPATTALYSSSVFLLTEYVNGMPYFLQSDIKSAYTLYGVCLSKGSA